MSEAERNRQTRTSRCRNGRRERDARPFCFPTGLDRSVAEERIHRKCGAQSPDCDARQAEHWMRNGVEHHHESNSDTRDTGTDTDPIADPPVPVAVGHQVDRGYAGDADARDRGHDFPVVSDLHTGRPVDSRRCAMTHSVPVFRSTKYGTACPGKS